MSAAPADDARPSTLSALCGTCRSIQPCAPRREWEDRPSSSPYRCLTCGQITPNPVLRLQPRRMAG